MDVVGSEIGQKMRSAIKAKLTELGCYVDDELPDYVMVMVANKRTRTQMEDDLQLFLVDNTKLFVNWLHQVLKKLQEVTVTTPIKLPDAEISKEMLLLSEQNSKEKNSKDKSKKSEMKKSKKKEKEKHHRKKEERKVHKSKKKSKHHEMIHPNVPPLLMNIEKESEPSITDVFAGQILKRHGFSVEETNDNSKQNDRALVLLDIKRPVHLVIDPSTIPSQSQPLSVEDNKNIELNPVISVETNRQEQLKEMNDIEVKIQGLKQKLTQQLDSISDEDEDFLNIRTEADELMNDFAEDVFQEISQPPPTTPPILLKSPIALSVKSPINNPVITPTEIQRELDETLPQIELRLPKRPMRERLEGPKTGVGDKGSRKTDIRTISPERFTPDRAPSTQSQNISIKSRLGNPREKRNSTSDDKAPNKSDSITKKVNSRVSVLDSRSTRSSCASVVRVRPRPRVQAPASNLLMKAMADAHKSLLNRPAKVVNEINVKRALVHPIRRSVDAQNIVIQVPVGCSSQADVNDFVSHGKDEDDGNVHIDDDGNFKKPNKSKKEEYVPMSITKKIRNNKYVPSKRSDQRKTSKKDDSLIIETINIHHSAVGQDKSTQFIVTMDGYHPNAFLAKKLLNEGILNTEDELTQRKGTKEKLPELPAKEKVPEKTDVSVSITNIVAVKPSSNTIAEVSDEVVIKKEDEAEDNQEQPEGAVKGEENPTPSVRKRKASPIVFDVLKREKETERVRTESVSSDGHVTISTTPNTHKYDSVPPLSQAERKATWCRAFPLCRYGSSCAFLHPRCKFAAACTRRDCIYSHGLLPVAVPLPAVASSPMLASHVVPAANYKSISAVSISGMCKYYPGCANPACHYYHPKPCRFGKGCNNKLECNFYHIDVPSKWKTPY